MTVTPIHFFEFDPIDDFNMQDDAREMRQLETRSMKKAAAKKKTAKKSTRVAKKPAVKPAATMPTLLSGGNPQIPKADGDAPVQAYIAAMPGWKREVGQRLDALIARTLPAPPGAGAGAEAGVPRAGVRKAVRWNSPFYGIEGQGWFLSFHCFTKYIKVTFLNGASLHPLPPVASKHQNTRYFHIHEGDPLDEKVLASWIKQASELPGDHLFQ